MTKVYYPSSFYNPDLSVLSSKFDQGVEFITGDKLPEKADFDVLVSGRPSREQITASPNLKYLIIPWAGVADEVKALLPEFPQINVHNLHHNAIPTAETAMTLLFAAAKQVIPIHNVFHLNDWSPRYKPNPALLLSGKTILILGFGEIGQHVARVCHAMGMRVQSVRRNLDKTVPEDIKVEIFGIDKLNKLLPNVDVLMGTLPLTDETEGLIGEREIGLLPDKAIVVNVGRGKVFDQKALYEGLESGKLHSAGIDVWYNYPKDEASRKNTPPSDYPFSKLPNVVMSPHRGGGSDEVEKLRMDALAKLVNSIHSGEEVPNKVDLKSGY